MKLSLITSAVLTLGATAFVPSMAKADVRDDHRNVDYRDVRTAERDVRSERDLHSGRDVQVDRDGRFNRDAAPSRDVRIERDVRVERDIRIEPDLQRRDFDRSVLVREVPRQVLDEAARVGNGRSIESVRFVRRAGSSFYALCMDGRNKQEITVRIAPDGCLVSIDR
jgi:hypothetical protein